MDWRIAGAYFEACNCEAICPCRKIGGVPGGRSTYGECVGVLGWRIDDGHADGVDLAGLHAALICRYHDDEPGSPWTIRLHVDQRGGSAERSAIEAILLGRAGGPHILKLPWVRKPSDLLEVVSSPIELRGGPPHELGVGDAAQLRATRPVEAQPAVACGIPGYERGGIEYNAEENAVDDAPFGWDFVGRCAFAGDFDYVSAMVDAAKSCARGVSWPLWGAPADARRCSKHRRAADGVKPCAAQTPQIAHPGVRGRGISHLAVPERYDMLVLGGGAAGCVAAARLAERQARVGLVEAGPDYGPYPEGRWPAEMLDARTLPMTHLWEQDEDDRSSSRARIIGGCSAHNGAMVVRGEPRDYEWDDDWTYAALEPYLDRADARLGTLDTITATAAPWHGAACEAAAALGVPAGPLRANVRGAVRWNAAFAYLDPVRDRVDVLAETLVDRVDPPRVHTDRGVLEADTIVLAAGAYGTPAILLRSGLGDELPVGANLIDHVGVGLGWEPTEACVRDTVAYEAEHGPVFEPYALVTPPDLHLIPWTTTGGAETSMPVFFLQPRSRGRVTLRSSDPRVPPAIEHGFLSDERDVEPLVAGVELARRLVRTEPLARYAGEELRRGPGDVAGYVRENVRGYFHPVGTCALGSVCDGRGRVLGHESLVVADASFIPAIPRANTHLTVLAVAGRIAEFL